MGVDFGQRNADPLTNYLGPSTVLQVAEEVRRQRVEEMRKQDDKTRIKEICDKY